MNGRGLYGTPRIGQFGNSAWDYAPPGSWLHPNKMPQGVSGQWAGTTPILIGAAIVIVGIGVIGTKRGVKWM